MEGICRWIKSTCVPVISIACSLHAHNHGIYSTGIVPHTNSVRSLLHAVNDSKLVLGDAISSYRNTYCDWTVVFLVTNNCLKKYAWLCYVIYCMIGPAPAYFTVTFNFSSYVSSALDQKWGSCASLAIKSTNMLYGGINPVSGWNM